MAIFMVVAAAVAADVYATGARVTNIDTVVTISAASVAVYLYNLDRFVEFIFVV